MHWNTATLTGLHIVCGCFHSTTAQLNSFDRGCIAKSIYYLDIYGKFADDFCKDYSYLSYYKVTTSISIIVFTSKRGQIKVIFNSKMFWGSNETTYVKLLFRRFAECKVPYKWESLFSLFAEYQFIISSLSWASVKGTTKYPPLRGCKDLWEKTVKALTLESIRHRLASCSAHH